MVDKCHKVLGRRRGCRIWKDRVRDTVLVGRDAPWDWVLRHQGKVALLWLPV